MAAFSYSLDDSSGENIGDGLDGGALDLSGSETLDDFSQSTEIGSSLDLADANVSEGATGAPSLLDQYSLSGVTDPMASDTLDTGVSDTNGAGSAASTHPATSSQTGAFDSSTFFSGVGKFGASIGQLFAAGTASTGAVVSSGIPNANPNRVALGGITTSHAVLIVGVVIVAGILIARTGRRA